MGGGDGADVPGRENLSCEGERDLNGLEYIREPRDGVGDEGRKNGRNQVIEDLIGQDSEYFIPRP